MDENFGIKDIYQGMILAKDPITINGVTYQENDVILLFDEIQEIVFQESQSQVAARGGFDNRELVAWATTNEVYCQLRMGRISQLGYGFVNQEALKTTGEILAIRQIESYKLDNGVTLLRHEPNLDHPFRVFLKNGVSVGEEILEYDVLDDTLKLDEEYAESEIMVDYYFSEDIGATIIPIGRKKLNGDFKFVGKFYETNEQTGSRNTAIIEIPRLKIQSNFNLILGRNVTPLIQNMTFSAIPVGERKDSKTIQITHLDQDIDKDF